MRFIFMIVVIRDLRFIVFYLVFGVRCVLGLSFRRRERGIGCSGSVIYCGFWGFLEIEYTYSFVVRRKDIGYL